MTIDDYRPAKVVTAFGTVLYLDHSGLLRHGDISSSPANVRLEVVGPTTSAVHNARLVFVSDSGKQSIACSASECRVSGDDSATNFQVVPLERGLFTLKNGGHFLSATPSGELSLSAQSCSTWELLLASENWCGEASTGCNVEYSLLPNYDVQRVREYLIHPTIRARAEATSSNPKILIYGYPGWSHGRVYYDLCKALHKKGYIVDILNWQENHAAYFPSLAAYYDLFVTSLDGIGTLIDAYNVPYNRVIAVSHHEFEIQGLIEQSGRSVFDRFAGYAVVSEYLYCSSLMKGVPRAPMVTPVGVDFESFYGPVSEALNIVGYASSMAVTTFGVEWKRGALAQAAVEAAGLEFRVAGSTGQQTSFHQMPQFYRAVDAIVTSSISEAAQLPVMEAAAAGRLVICTPVGHFPQKAYAGGGILAPVETGKFVAFTSKTLRYYHENPSAYVDLCHSIQSAARGFDWSHYIGDWIDLIEAARCRYDNRT